MCHREALIGPFASFLGWEYKKNREIGFSSLSPSSSLILVNCISVQNGDGFVLLKTKVSRFCMEIWYLLHQQANCFNYFMATFIFHFLYVMIHLRGTSRSSQRNWTSAQLQLLFLMACEATVVPLSLKEQAMCL